MADYGYVVVGAGHNGLVFDLGACGFVIAMARPALAVNRLSPPGITRTLWHTVNMNVSVRLDDGLAERLRLRARAAGETMSDRLRRYAEEGARRDEHPLITFRDGPTGRRAGVVGGPDVWEIAMWLNDIGDDPDREAALVADGAVSRAQVDAAVAYAAEYGAEVDARIELHRSATAAAARRS